MFEPADFTNQIVPVFWTVGLAILLTRQIQIWKQNRNQHAWHGVNVGANLLAMVALWQDSPAAMLLVLLAVGSELARSRLAVRHYLAQKREIEQKYGKD